MFPLNWNIPFIRKNGSRTTLGAITGDIAGIEEDVEDLAAQTSALWENIGQNGAKNILPKFGVGTYEDGGITFVVGSDGVVDANGTATGNPSKIESSIVPIDQTAIDVTEKYILSKGNENSQPRLRFRLYGADGTTEVLVVNLQDKENQEIDFSQYTFSYIKVDVSVTKNESVSHQKIYPMLRLASDTDPTYQLYAMTNRELTDEKLALSVLKSVVADSSDFADFKTKVAAL